jgi:ATP-dependent Clp protease protease subunit
MQDLLHQILARHTGQTVEKIADDFDRDYFMSASAAVDYGLIDEVLKPNEDESEPAEDAQSADADSESEE